MLLAGIAVTAVFIRNFSRKFLREKPKFSFSSMPIMVRITILRSTIILGILISLYFLVTSLMKGMVRNDNTYASQRSEQGMSALMRYRLAELRKMSALLAGQPGLNTAVASGDAAAIADVSRSLQANLGACRLEILDKGGSFLAGTGEARPDDDGSRSALAKRILEDGGMQALVRRGGKPVLVGGSPIGKTPGPGGALVLIEDLNENLAVDLSGFLKADVTFFAGGNMLASSLSRSGQEGLKRIYSGEGQGLGEGPIVQYQEISLPFGGMHAGVDSGKAGSKETALYVVRKVDLKTDNGETIGSAVIMTFVGHNQKQLSEARMVLEIVIVILFLLAFGISFRVMTSVTKPITEAIRIAEAIAAGDRSTPIKVTYKNEVGNLQQALEAMRLSLNGLIDDMDAKIKRGVEHVTNILDNLESGFLIFDRQGNIQPGYSRVSEEFFGKDLAGKKLEDILLLDKEEWSDIEYWRTLIFSEGSGFRKFHKLGPDSFKKQTGRHISFSYRPIYGSDKKTLEGVVLIATDKTVERQLARKFQLEKERVAIIITISTNREGFLDFIRDSQGLVHQLNQHVENATIHGIDVDSILRTLHTLKGNCGMYGCSGLKDIAHDLESGILELGSGGDSQGQVILPKLEDGIKALQEAVRKILENSQALIGEINDETEAIKRISVSKKTLADMELQFRRIFPKESESYRKFLDAFVFDPLLPALKVYEAAAKDIAERRGKRIKSFSWKGIEVKVRMPVYKRLVSSLVHAYRNAVDHGIEHPQDREDAGKEPEGLIEVALEVKGESEAQTLFIRIKDDGAGIDPDMMRRKVVERGFASESAAAAMDDLTLVQYIFSKGFSTAQQVTDISGRGVGMDAIAYEAKSLGGKAWVISKKGAGLELVISVPYVS